MKRYTFASKKDDSTIWYRRLEWLCSRAVWSQRESGASAWIVNTPSVRHSRNFNRHNRCFWRYVTREYSSSLLDSSECVISVADCPCWCVVLLFAVQTKVESTVKLLTAISRRLFWGCGAGSLTNRFMACQSLPMVVVRGNTTSIGKRSMCSTGGLRASLIFLSCILVFFNMQFVSASICSAYIMCYIMLSKYGEKFMNLFKLWLIKDQRIEILSCYRPLLGDTGSFACLSGLYYL